MPRSDLVAKLILAVCRDHDDFDMQLHLLMMQMESGSRSAFSNFFLGQARELQFMIEGRKGGKKRRGRWIRLHS